MTPKRPHIICTVTNDLHQEQRMHRTCSALRGEGYDVTLVGRERASSRKLPVQKYHQVRLPLKYESGKAFYAEYNWALYKWLMQQDVDLIISVDLDTLVPGIRVGKKKGIPVFYDAHEYFSETPEVIRRPWIQKIWEYVAQRYIPQSTFAYTVGPQLVNLMSKRYGVPFGLVRNVPFGKVGSSTRPPFEVPFRIVYQGMLNEGRGLEVVVEMMRHLPNFVLWLVGTGDIETELRVQVAHFSKEEQKRVVFKGFVEPADLPALTTQAHLGITTARNLGLSYYYSLANKTFDYIHAGLPALQTDFPEYRAVVEEYGTGVLIEEFTAEALAAQIKKIFENRSDYERMVQNCHEAAVQLTWEQEQIKLVRWVAYALAKQTPTV